MSKLGLESLTLQIQQQVKAWDQKKIRIHITYPQQTDRRRPKKQKNLPTSHTWLWNQNVILISQSAKRKIKRDRWRVKVMIRPSRKWQTAWYWLTHTHTLAHWHECKSTFESHRQLLSGVQWRGSAPHHHICPAVSETCAPPLSHLPSDFAFLLTSWLIFSLALCSFPLWTQPSQNIPLSCSELGLYHVALILLPFFKKYFSMF